MNFRNLFFAVLILGSITRGQSAPDSVSDQTIIHDQVPDSVFRWAQYPRYALFRDKPFYTTNLKPLPTIAIGSAVVASAVALHIHQQNAWWSGQRGKFHIEEDWVSALQVDKFGHAYGSYVMSYFFREACLSSGFGYDDAALLGSALGIGYQTYVEVEDGFATDWGFSPSDFYFDVLGGGLLLAQHYVPTLQNFEPKWLYVKTEWVGKPSLARPRTFVDDYNSSTFFISVNMHNLLPDDLKHYWPRWLKLAVGYGGDAVDGTANPNGPPDQLSKRRYVISLDYSLRDILPDGGGFFNWCWQTLDMLKLPSPSVEFSGGRTRFYLMYPFELKFGGFTL